MSLNSESELLISSSAPLDDQAEKQQGNWLLRIFSVPPLWLLVLALLTGQLGWAGYSVLLQGIGAESVDGLVFSFYRDLAAAPILLGTAFALEGVCYPRGWKEPLLFFALGFFLWANQFFFIEGNFYSSADVASMFQPTIPIWTFVFSMVLGVEPVISFRTNVGCLKGIGVLLGVLGAVTVVGATTLGTSDKSKNPFLGSIFLLGNTICMSLLVVGQRLAIFAKDKRAFMAHWKTRPISITAWYYTFGSICSALGAIYPLVHNPKAFSIPASSAGPLVYSVLVSSCLCFAIITWGSKHLHPSVVTSFWPSQVFFTIILSWFAFGDALSGLQWVAVVFIVLGLLGVSFGIFQADAESKKEFDPNSH